MYPSQRVLSRVRGYPSVCAGRGLDSSLPDGVHREAVTYTYTHANLELRRSFGGRCEGEHAFDALAAG